VLSGANRHDMTKLADLLDALLLEAPPAASGERHLCLDRGYDYDACREAATARGYTPHIPPKASAAQPLPPPGHPDRHPPRRWVVEVAHSWFNRFRRLLVRWEKKAANYLGFIQLAAILIIYRKLRHAHTPFG
jgi:putative transposase